MYHCVIIYGNCKDHCYQINYKQPFAFPQCLLYKNVMFSEPVVCYVEIQNVTIVK